MARLEELDWTTCTWKNQNGVRVFKFTLSRVQVTAFVLVFNGETNRKHQDLSGKLVCIKPNYRHIVVDVKRVSWTFKIGIRARLSRAKGRKERKVCVRISDPEEFP